MRVEEKWEIPAAQELDGEVMPPCPVDAEAMVLLVDRSDRLPCRIVELSLTGCRMRLSAKGRFPVGSRLRVEATFKVRGIAFRFAGVAEWDDGDRQVDIRFAGLIPRRRDELIEVLCELEAEIAAKAEKEAAEKRAAEELATPAAKEQTPEQSEVPALVELLSAAPPEIQAERTSSLLPASQPARTVLEPAPGPILVAAPAAVASKGAPPKQPAHQQAGQPPAKHGGRERRAQLRHEVDTSAELYLVNLRAVVHGRIRDLSVGGCRIRTDERFPVGIYTRVETEFRLEGLPFRLGGVIQAIHDRERRLVGIRFLDMSDRKREQVEQLMEEIQQMEEHEKQTQPQDPTAESADHAVR